ncbi:hypothetical protein P4571_08055 [Niallia alba]|uniref:hypothetical protein n=1 Tax=Niallia alba TaxID=2729105 RepID=UPI002E23D86F|nr:hypothetical protein [Niallia alba]
MDTTEKFKKVMNILEENELCNSTVNHNMFDKLTEEDFLDKDLIESIIVKIKGYEDRMENNPNKYPENIMQYLRQREGLDKYDTSYDLELNKLSKNQVFKEVLNWNGLLGGYDSTIKNWITDIYEIDLNSIR